VILTRQNVFRHVITWSAWESILGILRGSVFRSRCAFFQGMILTDPSNWEGHAPRRGSRVSVINVMLVLASSLLTVRRRLTALGNFLVEFVVKISSSELRPSAHVSLAIFEALTPPTLTAARPTHVSMKPSPWWTPVSLSGGFEPMNKVSRCAARVRGITYHPWQRRERQDRAP
jgi:hypothetical protein